MFEDTVQFPFAANLERHWRIIRDEMVALRSTSFIAWPEKSLYGKTGWSTFGLYAFGMTFGLYSMLTTITEAAVLAQFDKAQASLHSQCRPISAQNRPAHLTPQACAEYLSRFGLRVI